MVLDGVEDARVRQDVLGLPLLHGDGADADPLGGRRLAVAEVEPPSPQVVGQGDRGRQDARQEGLADSETGIADLGTEIRKTRPAVVVSNDSCNRDGSRVVVLRITSNVVSLFPGEAEVRVRGAAARALGDQACSVDKRRLTSRIGALGVDEMESVDDALRITLPL